MQVHKISSASSARRNKAGLTLIELIVVLFILAAIAGIAVAAFPGFQKLTHGSTSANAIRAGENVIATNLVRGNPLGNLFDGLITQGNVIPAFIANSDGLVASGALSAAEVDALNELGITAVIAANDTTPENATFEGHLYGDPLAATPVGPTTIDVSTANQLAVLAPPAFTRAVNDYNVVGEYDRVFVFGLGQECTLVGANSTFKEAPVHTPGEGSAVTTYARYVVLVGFNATEGEAGFIGITCIDDGENFNNINRNLGEYFEAG